MTILHQYNNGNTHVVLHNDGSKERTYEGVACPIHPESMDVKITNYCDVGCAWCHEQSTKNGKHADLDKLGNVLSVLPPGVEIALGGGNPLAHPDLVSFLERVKIQGLVANITVNQKHLRLYKNLILFLIKKDLVKGIGISCFSPICWEDVVPIFQASDNVVFHVIMGLNSVDIIEELYWNCFIELGCTCKILVLGYKNFGNGVEYALKNNKIDDNKYRWYTQLAKHFKEDFLVLSFDNLAIKQLKLQRYFTSEGWEKFFSLVLS